MEGVLIPPCPKNHWYRNVAKGVDTPIINTTLVDIQKRKEPTPVPEIKASAERKIYATKRNKFVYTGRLASKICMIVYKVFGMRNP